MICRQGQWVPDNTCSQGCDKVNNIGRQTVVTPALSRARGGHAGVPPARHHAHGQPRPGHLQNLISLLDALFLCRAARLHPRHEDAHVVAPRQPHPNAGPLAEADHARVRAVPARGRGGNTEAGQARVGGAGAGQAGGGGAGATVLGGPAPSRASVSQTAPQNLQCTHQQTCGKVPQGVRESRAGRIIFWGIHTHGPPCSDGWTPCRCHSRFAWGRLKGNSWSFPGTLAGPPPRPLP